MISYLMDLFNVIDDERGDEKKKGLLHPHPHLPHQHFFHKTKFIIN